VKAEEFSDHSRKMIDAVLRLMNLQSEQLYSSLNELESFSNSLLQKTKFVEFTKTVLASSLVDLETKLKIIELMNWLTSAFLNPLMVEALLSEPIFTSLNEFLITSDAQQSILNQKLCKFTVYFYINILVENDESFTRNIIKGTRLIDGVFNAENILSDMLVELIPWLCIVMADNDLLSGASEEYNQMQLAIRLLS
jgi:hypothetical protein